MSKAISKDKATAIAEHYCTHSFCKKDTLVALGYSEKYAKSPSGGKVFDMPIVREQIAAIMARNSEICDVEVEEIIRGLRQKAFPSEDEHVTDANQIRALELLGKYKLMFGDKLLLEPGKERRQLDEAEQKAATILAPILLERMIDAERKEIAGAVPEQTDTGS